MIRMRVPQWVGLSLAAHAVAGGALFWTGSKKAVVDRPSGALYVTLVKHPATDVEPPVRFIPPRHRPKTDGAAEKRGQAGFSGIPGGKTSLSPFLDAGAHETTASSDVVIDPSVPTFHEAPPSDRDGLETHAMDLADRSVDTTSAPTTSAPSSNGTDDYRAVVVAAIKRVKRYPELARTRAMEGTVQIAFTIHPDGRLSDPELVVPSRYALLNHAALAVVRRMRSVPPPPSTAPLRFAASIRYRLLDDSTP